MKTYQLPPNLAQAAQRARANQPAMKSVTTKVKSSWEHSARAGEKK